ncbi:MAG: tetratricopeptide repeat protein [Aquificaceae bacterium]
MRRVVLLLLSSLFSCSMPGIVVWEDPLTAEEHVNLGYIYEKKGELDLAKGEYQKAIKKDKSFWVAYYNLGNIYAKEGNYKKAQESYRRALDINPEDPDTLNNLAYVLFKQGKKEEALVLIKKAINMEDKKEYRNTLKEIEDN